MDVEVSSHNLHSVLRKRFHKTIRRLIFVGTLSALFLAIMYHGAYNCMIQTESIKFLGILLPIFTYAAVFLAYNKVNLKKIFMNV